MKPPFTINGSDRHISLELLSYKTAFLVALASGARGSELVALSRATHNLDFTFLPSGAKQVSIKMVPKFIPKNQRPEVIPEPIVFPGMAHLFPKDPERLLCPVRALGLYIVRSEERAQTDPLEKLFVHFNPNTPHYCLLSPMHPIYFWCFNTFSWHDFVSNNLLIIATFGRPKHLTRGSCGLPETARIVGWGVMATGPIVATATHFSGRHHRRGCDLNQIWKYLDSCGRAVPTGGSSWCF